LSEASPQAKGARTSADRVVLYEPRRTGLVSLAFYGALAVALGVLGAVLTNEATRVLSWVFAAFFAMCALLAVKTIINRDHLVLTRDGLTISTAGGQVDYAWSQIHGFYSFERKSVVRLPARVHVGIDFVEGRGGFFSEPLMRFAYRLTERPGTNTRVVKGHPGSLPSTYGLKPDELVNLLEGWRRRAGR
jgi:hypothetical protein